MKTIHQNQVFELTLWANRQPAGTNLQDDPFGEFTTPSGTVLQIGRAHV